ncbi:MAG: hypothetical protein FJ263_02110 [Planctomycetes bacterium]|nr:hypothetical protein [Planctomycetota bacterium]
MSKKKGNFADQYLDKIILGLAGLLAVYLLWAFVLSNPYGQKVSNQKVSPSQIDVQNKLQAQQIENKLQDRDMAKANPYVQDKAAEFLNWLGCAMPKLSITANWPLPGGGQAEKKRIYVLPQIPAMDIVKVASIRGTVRMPTEDVTPEIPYSTVASKAADLDLVTISAHLNLQALYNNFRQSFMGPRLKPQWRDPTYAEPVPARIEMQRRVQNADGSWGPWQTVPFTRIDPYQKMFKDIPLTTEQMTYGNVAMFMNSCRDFAVMKDILQPSPYDFLSMQKWLPPEYYEEYQKISDEEEAKKLREERERRLREKESAKGGNRAGAANRPQPQQQTQPRRGVRAGENPMMGEGMMSPTGMMPPTPVRPVKAARTVQDVERDAAAAALADKSKLGTLKDIIVWIHDDTTVAGATYQYRIRYGVFNPIAGKDWVAPESKAYENHVVLWSAYAEILNPVTGLPESVSIPKMLQMFPMDVLADGTGASVEIYKYHMGQWHTETFEVHFGQMIGKPMESKPQAAIDGMEAGMMMNPGMNPRGMDLGGVQQSTLVDYSTEYMLMDVQMLSDWSSVGVRQRTVPWMLCIDNANQILTLAAKKQYWSKEMTAEYAGVKSEMLKTSGIPSEGMMMPGMEGGMQPGMTTRPYNVGGGF